jgi:hypothetical protein
MIGLKSAKPGSVQSTSFRPSPSVALWSRLVRTTHLYLHVIYNVSHEALERTKLKVTSTISSYLYLEISLDQRRRQPRGALVQAAGLSLVLHKSFIIDTIHLCTLSQPLNSVDHAFAAGLSSICSITSPVALSLRFRPSSSSSASLSSANCCLFFSSLL